MPNIRTDKAIEIMKARRNAREPILVPFDEEAPPQSSGRRIGEMLLDSGMIRRRDIGRVLRTCQAKQLRFGEAAVDLELVDEEDVEAVLTRQLESLRLPGLKARKLIEWPTARRSPSDPRDQRNGTSGARVTSLPVERSESDPNVSASVRFALYARLPASITTSGLKGARP